MKDVYLIYWWCPEPYERESRFYAANQRTDKETLGACASVASWIDNWKGRRLSKALDKFETECKDRFGLIRLNIKPTHKTSIPEEEVKKHYEKFIKSDKIICIQIGSAPQND